MDTSKRAFIKTAAGGLVLFTSTGSALAQNEAIEITNLIAPSEARPGDSIEITGDVRNTSNRRQTVTIEYRIDNRVLDSRELTLSGGIETSIELEPELPTDLDGGTYTHGLFVGGTDRGAVAGITITVPGQSAFTVRNFVGPSRVRPGERVSVRARITNTGSKAGSTRLQYRIGNSVVTSRNVNLRAGQSVQVRLRGRIPDLAPGTYTQGLFIQGTNVGQTGSIVVGREPGRFEVLSLQTEAEARSGDEIAITATVRNTGTSRGSTTFEYRIGDRQIASRNVALDGGQRATIELSGTVPTLPAGRYLQGVFDRDTGSGLTSRLTIQSSAASFSLTSLFTPARAGAGDTVSARATVRNSGNGSGSTTLRYRIDGVTVATRSVSLDAGESRTVTFEGTVPDRATGTYEQGVYIQGTNRRLMASLRIVERPAAAFSVSRLRTASTVEPGSDIAVSATVTNTGNATGTTVIEYRIDGERVASQRVTLPAGRSTTVSFDVTVPDLGQGTYLQGVFLEGTNRGQAASLRVSEPPGFRISGLQTTPSATVGDAISAKATLRNRGTSRETKTVEYRIGNRIVSEMRVQLAAGQRRTVTLSGTVPDVAAGTYQQGIFVEGESATQRLTVQVRQTPRADIRVTNFDGPSEMLIGGTVSVDATVRNAGDDAGTTTIEYRIDDRIVTARQLTLEPGAERTVTLQGVVPSLSAGSHDHGVFVAGTTRGQSAAVTLQAGTAQFTVGNLRGPARVMAGDEITVRATLTNTGTADGEVTVEYRLDGETVATQTVDVDEGESEDVTFDVTVPDVDPDTYRHGVFVGDTDRGQTTSLVVEGEPTPTPTATPTDTPTETPDDSDSAFGPGFGPGAGIAGLAGAAGVARLYGRYVGSGSSGSESDTE